MLENRTSYMPCPICESLHREHNELCGREAALTLAERETTLTPGKRKALRSEKPLQSERSTMSPTAAGASTADTSREQILLARKRQMQVASELENHKALAHSA